MWGFFFHQKAYNLNVEKVFNCNGMFIKYVYIIPTAVIF